MIRTMLSVLAAQAKKLLQSSRTPAAKKSPAKLGLETLETREVPSVAPVLPDGWPAQPPSVPETAAATAAQHKQVRADPDDTVAEVNALIAKKSNHASNLGQLVPAKPVVRTDAIQVSPVTASGTPYKNLSPAVGWNDFKSVNGKDVDLCRVTAKAGDRVQFRVETVKVEHAFVDPTKKKGTPPIEDKRQLGVRLELFDGAGRELPFGIGGDPRISSPVRREGPNNGTIVWEMEFTFSADGDYFLGVSEYANSTYDPAGGGADDYSGSANFGPYTLTATYLEKHLPDLVARDIRWDNGGVVLEYDVRQKEIPGVGRPDDWRLGGLLYWVGADGVPLGRAGGDRVTDLANQKTGPYDQIGRKLWLSERQLGDRPAGATHLAFVMNATKTTPELDPSNNIALLKLDGVPGLGDLRAVGTTATDGKTVEFRYEVDNNPLTGPYRLTVYRGASPTFGGDLEKVTSAPLPEADESGADAGDFGPHTVVVSFGAELRGTAARPYLFVVAEPASPENPGTPGVFEADLNNNSAPLGRVTEDQLRALFGEAGAANTGPLNRTLGEFGIITYKRQAAFLAQLGVESNRFTRFEENLNYTTVARLRAVYPSKFPIIMLDSAVKEYLRDPEKLANYVYADRYGNTAAGDGWKYRGRGPIQLTWKDNYAAAGKALGLDLVANPDLVSSRTDPLVGFRVAGWFWDRAKLNIQADKLDQNPNGSADPDAASVDKITRGINPHLNKKDRDARVTPTFVALSVLRPAADEELMAARDATVSATGPTTRGVTAVLFGGWSGQSVKNFHDVVRASPVTSFELGFAPSLSGSSNPYKNARTLLLGGQVSTANGTRNLRGLLTTDKQITLNVYLGFHGKGTSLDETAANLAGRVEAFRRFATADAGGVPLYQKVRLVLTPSLEDNYTSHDQFMSVLQAIAAELPADVLKGITIRRIPSPDAIREGWVDASVGTVTLTAKNAAVGESVALAHEYHGLPADARKTGYSVLSNDGYFVWSDRDGDKNKRPDESATTAANTKNPDMQRSDDKQSLSTFLSGLPSVPYDTALLWRPAYNLHTADPSERGEPEDIEGWAKPDIGDRSDTNKNPHFDRREAAVLRAFLSVGLARPRSGGPPVVEPPVTTPPVVSPPVVQPPVVQPPVSPPVVAAPAVPSALRTENVWARAADVRWDALAGVVSEYRIAVSRDGENWANAGVVGGDRTSFRLDGLIPNTRLWVKVRASGPGGLSEYSNTVDFVTRGEAPAAPGNLRAANVWARTVDLNWDRVPHAEAYKVFRSQDGHHFVEVGTVGGDSAGFRATDLQPGTRYFFRVQATNQFGGSGFSNTIEVTTRREPPAAAGNLRAANVWARAIDLNWDDRSSTESGFVVQISTNGSTFQEVGRVGPDTPRFRVESLRPNTQYWFRVLSFNEAGEAVSTVIAVRTRA